MLNRILPFFFYLVFPGSLWAAQGVVVRSAMLLEQPVFGAKSVQALSAGSEVELLQREGGWQHVRLVTKSSSAEAVSGWVRGYQVRAGIEPQSIKMTENQTSRNSVVSGLTALSSRSMQVFRRRDSDAANRENVVATIGIRGLSEEDLKRAKADPQALLRMQAARVEPDAAKGFAQAVGLQVQAVDWLPESGKRRRK